jgi:hypothetical protein
LAALVPKLEEATMRATQTASQQIIEVVTSWQGVEAGPGRRGELAFRVGRRELGHLHGDHAAHFLFPKRVWAELERQRRIVPHPVFPDAQGLAARMIEGEADVRDVIRLLRLNYERVVARHPLAADPSMPRAVGSGSRQRAMPAADRS